MTKRTVIKITIPVFLIILVVAAMAAVRVRRSLLPPVEYFTATIEKGPLQKIINATGSVQTVVTVPVGSQVSGQVQELFADFNSVVKKNQVIARIDPDIFEAKVNQAKAQVDAARAAVLNQQAATGNNVSGWFNGDLDYNGKIDGADYALIDAAFNSGQLRSAGSIRLPPFEISR